MIMHNEQSYKRVQRTKEMLTLGVTTPVINTFLFFLCRKNYNMGKCVCDWDLGVSNVIKVMVFMSFFLLRKLKLKYHPQAHTEIPPPS
jgi:hypothetical protein